MRTPRFQQHPRLKPDAHEDPELPLQAIHRPTQIVLVLVLISSPGHDAVSIERCTPVNEALHLVSLVGGELVNYLQLKIQDLHEAL